MLLLAYSFDTRTCTGLNSLYQVIDEAEVELSFSSSSNEDLWEILTLLKNHHCDTESNSAYFDTRNLWPNLDSVLIITLVKGEIQITDKNAE